MPSVLLTCYNDGQLWPGVGGHWLPTWLPGIPLALLMFDSSNTLSVRVHLGTLRVCGTRVCGTQVVAARLCDWSAARQASNLDRARFQAELETTSCRQSARSSNREQRPSGCSRRSPPRIRQDRCGDPAALVDLNTPALRPRPDIGRVATVARRSCLAGPMRTGLEGNSRGNPVMSHGPHGPHKLLIRPVEGGQAGAGSTRDTSLTRHAIRRSGKARVTQRHQPPTLAGPSHHRRYRHAKTHRHANGTMILLVFLVPLVYWSVPR